MGWDEIMAALLAALLDALLDAWDAWLRWCGAGKQTSRQADKQSVQNKEDWKQGKPMLRDKTQIIAPGDDLGLRISVDPICARQMCIAPRRRLTLKTCRHIATPRQDR